MNPPKAPTHPNSPTVIQVQAVDNGFTIQAVAVDGVNRNFRRVAKDVEDVKTQLHEIVNLFHEPYARPEKNVTPTTQPEPDPAPAEAPAQ